MSEVTRTVKGATGYELKAGNEKIRRVPGTELAGGIPVTRKAGEEIALKIALAK